MTLWIMSFSELGLRNGDGRDAVRGVSFSPTGWGRGGRGSEGAADRLVRIRFVEEDVRERDRLVRIRFAEGDVRERGGGDLESGVGDRGAAFVSGWLGVGGPGVGGAASERRRSGRDARTTRGRRPATRGRGADAGDAPAGCPSKRAPRQWDDLRTRPFGFQPDHGGEVAGATNVRSTAISAGDVRATRCPRAQTVWVRVAPRVAPTL